MCFFARLCSCFVPFLALISFYGSEAARSAAEGPRGDLEPEPRYEPARKERIDDGWGAAQFDEDEEPPRLATTVTIDASRTVIARNDSPDIPFDRSVNPYRGCEHGCVYCYARPSHAFLGLSPGLDFESRLVAKPEAPKLLAQELAKPGYTVEPLALGTNTDPYQPIEREMRITRGILEVLRDFNHPVTITTKSALVLRDLDILAAMAERGLAHVGISVTTLDAALARAMEPRAPSPRRRLAAIRALSESGIPTAVMAAPLIPALNDFELERILEAAAREGATGCRLYAPAPAARDQGPLLRMARGAFPGARQARALAHPRHAGRQAQRPQLRQPLLRPGPLCRAHTRALPARLEAARAR